MNRARSGSKLHKIQLSSHPLYIEFFRPNHPHLGKQHTLVRLTQNQNLQRFTEIFRIPRRSWAPRTTLSTNLLGSEANHKTRLGSDLLSSMLDLRPEKSRNVTAKTGINPSMVRIRLFASNGQDEPSSFFDLFDSEWGQEDSLQVASSDWSIFPPPLVFCLYGLYRVGPSIRKVCHYQLLSIHVCPPWKLLVLRLSPVSCVGSTSGLESTAKATKSTPICSGSTGPDAWIYSTANSRIYYCRIFRCFSCYCSHLSLRHLSSWDWNCFRIWHSPTFSIYLSK